MNRWRASALLGVLAVAGATSAIGAAPAAKALKARSVSIRFDIVPTPWAGQAESHDPNLIFLAFRGGIRFSARDAIATATLVVNGTVVGSTTADDSCTLCGGTTWQFAAPGFPSNPVFLQPAIVDFTPVQPGQAEIRLSVDRGVMEFGAAPYTTNAPNVVFDYITCCTTFWPVTMDAQNLTYEEVHDSAVAAQ
jgi:hypothetical protein